MNWLRYLGLLLALPMLLSAETYHPHDYKSGFATIQALGRDIYNSLPATERSQIGSNPISIDSSPKPFVRLLYFREGNQIIRGVWVSQGYVDLVNHLAHAKAIDQKRRGYLARYIQMLEYAEDSIPQLPDRDNPDYWTDNLLNEQLSNFNSIVGIFAGIQLAQHYLGLYEKYEHHFRNNESAAVSLNSLLTREEWEQSYRRGLANAMEASCMTEGFLPICEALNEMKHRPAWVACFFPENIPFKAMRKDMARIQYKFLND